MGYCRLETPSKMKVLILFASLVGLCYGRSGMIINGNDVTPIGEYPWMVALENTSRFHFCGASLIGTEWVMTAAHCIDGNIPPYVVVVLGQHDRSGTEGQQTFVEPAQFIMHPDYSFPYADIALIRLTSPVQETQYIQYGRIAQPSDGDFANQRCMSIGWGYNEIAQVPNVLQETEITAISNDECAARIGYYPSEGELCIFDSVNEDTGICSGDSGSPLNCPDGNGGYIIAGTLSWAFMGIGPYPCVMTLPQGYTRVST